MLESIRDPQYQVRGLCPNSGGLRGGKDILHRAILGLCFLGVLEDVLYRFDSIDVGTALLSSEKEDSVEPRVGPNG
jgi:hypothetical protein